MEFLPYCHSTQSESRLRKHRGQGHSPEIQLVIKHSVIFHLAVPVSRLSHTSPVGKNLEFNFPGRHYPDLHQRLCPRQTTDNHVFSLFCDSNFRKHFRKQCIIELVEILLHRSYQHTCHIGTARTHHQMVRTFGKIMMRPVRSTENDNRAVFP